MIYLYHNGQNLILKRGHFKSINIPLSILKVRPEKTSTSSLFLFFLRPLLDPGLSKKKKNLLLILFSENPSSALQ